MNGSNRESVLQGSSASLAAIVHERVFTQDLRGSRFDPKMHHELRFVAHESRSIQHDFKNYCKDFDLETPNRDSSCMKRDSIQPNREKAVWIAKYAAIFSGHVCFSINSGSNAHGMPQGLKPERNAHHLAAGTSTPRSLALPIIDVRVEMDAGTHASSGPSRRAARAP